MPTAREKRSQEEPTGVRPSLPVWKKAVFLFVTVALFFGLLELVLLLVGVKPLLYEEDPYVGFSSQIPLFVESGSGKRMVTARNKLSYFNKQEFPKRKGGNTTRIFCLGGSTTYGRPYDDTTSFCGWLRELLPVADPSRDWEVINAGGISYASYRVAALMEELAEYEPDVFVVYCGQNEFLERRTYSGIIEMPKPVRGLTAVLSRTRTFSATSRLVRGGPQEKSSGDGGQLEGEVKAILDESVGPEDYERDEELEEQVLAHYRYNMARIADIARASGAELVFVTPASNLRNCSPFKSQHRDGLSESEKERWSNLYAGARDHLAAGRPAEALAELEEAATIDDQYAHLHYLRGRVLDALERFEESKVAYERALNEDVCPLRALTSMPAIVKEVAEDRDVPVVDFVAMVEAESPHRIAGEELFLDHVHPTIKGHRLLALALVEELERQGVVAPVDDWTPEAVERVAAKIMSKVDPEAQGVAMRNLSKVYSWAGKMEDAYAAAKKALELFPGDAETHYQVGNLAHRLGKTDEAIERLSYLVSVNLSRNVGFYVKAHGQLADMLAEQGDHAASEQVLQKLLRLDPGNEAVQARKVDLLVAQGMQLSEQGKYREAVEVFREVVRRQPERFEGRVQLAVSLMRAGNLEQAAPVLEDMIERRPDYLAAYNNLSYVLAQLDRLDEAESVCRAALEVDPEFEPAKKNLQLILKKKAGP